MMRPPSRTSTLSQIVADVLRQSLQDGVYACGERMVELTIADELNVSQNTVRDALRILEQQGWVHKRPRYGVYVRQFTASQADELYALRSALEQLALKWAMRADDADGIAGLRHIISEAQTFIDVENGHGARQAVFTFHTALVHIAGKPQTAELLNHMHNQCRLLENLRADTAPRNLTQWQAILRQYDQLVTQMEAGDVPSACALLEAIIKTDAKHILIVLDLVGDAD